MEQVLAVAFKDNLEVSILHGINENIREFRLHFRMQMRFRLFENEDRAFGSIIAENQYRKHLGDAETTSVNRTSCPPCAL